MSDEMFKDVLLHDLADDHELVTTTTFHSPNFGIDEIQAMMRNLYIDRFSRPGYVNKLDDGQVALKKVDKRYGAVFLSEAPAFSGYNGQEFRHATQ